MRTVPRLTVVDDDFTEGFEYGIESFTVFDDDSDSYANVRLGAGADMASELVAEYSHEVDAGVSDWLTESFGDSVVSNLTGIQVVVKARGLGSLLLKSAMREARKRGAVMMWLQAFGDRGMQEALERFYVRHGFREANLSGYTAHPYFWRKL